MAENNDPVLSQELKSMKRLPIGYSDYKQIIDDNFYYVDKTLLINDLVQRGGQVSLIPRPRRFGKTLNMSMLRYFFEKTAIPHQHANLFQDKKVWQFPDMQALQGQFPVIYLTLKGAKELSWPDTHAKIKFLISELFKEHYYLLTSTSVSTDDITMFKGIVSQTAPNEHYTISLLFLARLLKQHHDSKVIILIDEYDAPIHQAFVLGYYTETIAFMRSFLGDALKDNQFLERAVITGILRTAKEGIFSGLNNLKVFTVLDDRIADKFGFTQDEINLMLSDYNLTSIHDEFKSWYNGYHIGNIKAYNPWSALNCVDKSGTLTPYWVNTSDNALVFKIVAQGDAKIKEQCADLIAGKQLPNLQIEDKMILPGMLSDENSIWSLMLFTGYVTVASHSRHEGIYSANLVLPNKELGVLFKGMVDDLFKQSLGSSNVRWLEKALIDADGDVLADLLSKFIKQSMSFYDIDAEEPERSYHLFVLGLMVTLAHRYAVRSNRESGYGRYDIMLIPHDKNLRGIIIEFKKKNDKETLEQCAERALEQIHNKQYVAEMTSLGIPKVVCFGIAVYKKEILLKQV